MITVNGTKTNDGINTLLSDYLKDKEYNFSCIAVEINGNIIAKKDYYNTTINDGDVIEIVSFVGGG